MREFLAYAHSNRNYGYLEVGAPGYKESIHVSYDIVAFTDFSVALIN